MIRVRKEERQVQREGEEEIGQEKRGKEKTRGARRE